MAAPTSPGEDKYPFQKYLNDLSEFRKLIFRDPQFNPHWSVWQPIWHLTDVFLDKGGDIDGWLLPIRPGDQEKMMAIIKFFSTPQEMAALNNRIRQNGAQKEVPNTLCTLIRKQGPETHRREETAWERSDFRHEYEFLPMHFGKVPRNTPYTKKSEYTMVKKGGVWYTLKAK